VIYPVTAQRRSNRLTWLCAYRVGHSGALPPNASCARAGAAVAEALAAAAGGRA
jgi:hypothetical protein